MARLEVPTSSDMTEEQRGIYEETKAGLRGYVPQPLKVWLKSPELARRAQKLGEFVRYQTSLPRRISELAILVTARHWTAHYEWFAHKADALKAGLSPTVIDAIAHCERPRFEKRDEKAVYDFCVSLHHTQAVPEDLYRAVVEAVGEQATVELVGLLGYYTLISMTLKAFDIGLPAGVSPELVP